MQAEKAQSVQPTHSVEAPEDTTAAPKSTSNYLGKLVRILKSGPQFFTRLFTTSEGTEKAMKLAGFVLLLGQVHYQQRPQASLISSIAKRVSEGGKFLKVRGWAGTVDYFLQMRFSKDRLVNVLSMGCLCVAATLEQALWLRGFGFDLGAKAVTGLAAKLPQVIKVLQPVARLPVVQAVAAVSLKQLQMGFALVGVSLGIVASIVAITKGGDRTKQLLKIADNVGKVGLIVFSGMAFTYGFATWGILAASVGVAKVLYGMAQERQKELKTDAEQQPLFAHAKDHGIPLAEATG